MLKVILSGCCGKMGRVINSIIEEDEALSIVAGVDPFGEKYADFPVFPDFSELPEADVIIDFSHPSALDGLLTYALKTKTPVVIATTGYNEAETEKIKAAAGIIPVFFTFNLSLGVNLMVSLAKKATAFLGDSFNIEIIEKHHNQKVYAPSGTAIMLAKAVNETLDNKMIYEYDRHSKRQKRNKNEIGIHSVRGGTIVGEHEVIFAGNNEIISIKHEAFSKTVFANGSVTAAKFIAGKPAGLYNMNNVLDF